VRATNAMMLLVPGERERYSDLLPLWEKKWAANRCTPKCGNIDEGTKKGKFLSTGGVAKDRRSRARGDRRDLLHLRAR